MQLQDAAKIDHTTNLSHALDPLMDTWEEGE